MENNQLYNEIQQAENDLAKAGERLNALLIQLKIDQKHEQNKPAAPSTKPPTAPQTKLDSTKAPKTNPVEQLFPPELSAMLSFEDKGDYTQVKPKQFLGSENFAKIGKIVKENNGEYISAGRDSHFRIHKKRP